MNWLNIAAVAALATVGGLVSAPGPSLAQSVVTYHNSPDRSGNYTVPGLTLAAAAKLHQDTGFQASVSGNVYAQPLYWQPSASAAGLLIVATESNQIYALNADTGAQIWMTQLATPLPNPQTRPVVRCGNIDPEGVTGTPVIDPATGTIYLDAMTLQSGNVPRQMIYALSLSDGKILPNWPLDVDAGMAARHEDFASDIQGQRSALQFAGGRLYVNYAGRAGDCGAYHGTVIEFTVSATPHISGSWLTRAVRGGIWAQGGVISAGNSLFVTTGNTSGATDWGDGEAVVRLRAGLAHSSDTRNYFTPANWSDLDKGDADLGGTAAVPFTLPTTASGIVPQRILALGKDKNAYLLNGANLGGIGAQLAKLQVSNAGIVTAPAIFKTATGTMIAFSNKNGVSPSCSGPSLTMLKVTVAVKDPMTIAWCTIVKGYGPPIITTTDGTANPMVWTVGAEGDNMIHGLNALNGKELFAGGGVSMSGLHHFGTLIAANRHLYIAADGTVYAFTF